MEIKDTIGSLGIIPVIKIDDAEKAIKLAQALIRGGLPVAEITFRTNAAKESIKRIVSNFPNMLVGAGTVLCVKNVRDAINAGASFIVTPGFNPKVVDYCIAEDIPIFPGVNSPSEIEQGLERGLKVLKYFPAEASGGIKAIKAVAAAYGDILFIPTGGINQTNICDYLSVSNVLACGGSWMVKSELISSGEFQKITELTEEAVKTVLGFEFAHIGINSKSEKHAAEGADRFKDLFGFLSKVGNSSIFSGTSIEIMKKLYLGSHGHIAVRTNRISLAISYLGQRGFQIREETKKTKNGKLVAVYLEEEIAGFAIHLVQK